MAKWKNSVKEQNQEVLTKVEEVHGQLRELTHHLISNGTNKPLHGDVETPCARLSGLTSCYYFSNDKLNWLNAVNACKKMQMHLIVVSSAFEQSVLASYLQFSAATHWWIGLSDSASNDDDFAWSSGQPYNYTNWESGGARRAGPGCVQLLK